MCGARGACREDLLYLIEPARAICARCEVRRACLKYALDFDAADHAVHGPGRDVGAGRRMRQASA